MTVVLLLVIAIGTAFWYRRMNMLAKDLDAYARFTRTEAEFAKVLVEVTERVTEGLVAAISGMARFVSSRFRKA
jgi:hypothetical protein